MHLKTSISSPKWVYNFQHRPTNEYEYFRACWIIDVIWGTNVLYSWSQPRNYAQMQLCRCQTWPWYLFSFNSSQLMPLNGRIYFIEKPTRLHVHSINRKDRTTLKYPHWHTQRPCITRTALWLSKSWKSVPWSNSYISFHIVLLTS